MARPRILRRVAQKPAATFYKPRGIPLSQLKELTLSFEGLEALRLVDAMGLDQETAAGQMEVSKPTLCRILAEARQTVARALTGGYALRIFGGNYLFAEQAQNAHAPRCRCQHIQDED